MWLNRLKKQCYILVSHLWSEAHTNHLAGEVVVVTRQMIGLDVEPAFAIVAFEY